MLTCNVQRASVSRARRQAAWLAVLLADQLEHLITLTELPTVSIQVMPLAAGVHAGVGDTILTQYIKGLP